ncbi:MAG: hypothetical protein Q9197_003352 [Variospora fuerteventurae]
MPQRFSPSHYETPASAESQDIAPTPKRSAGKRRNTDQEQDDATRWKRKANADFMKIFDKLKATATKFISNVEKEQDISDSRLSELQQNHIKVTRDGVNLKALQGNNKRIMEDLEAFRKKATDSIEINEMLKVDLIKQQPVSQLPDSEVVMKYHRLHEAISSWVNDEVSIFEGAWKKLHGCYPDANQFGDGGNPCYRQFLDAGFGLGGEYLLESLIQQELHKELFSEGMMFFGLDYQENMFIRKVEEGLSKLDPPRTIRYLRSENLKGFCQSEDFRRGCADSMSLVEERILVLVNTILPRLQDQPCRAQLFLERVVEPAFKLAIAVKTSATSYGFSCPFTLGTQFMKLQVHPHETSNHTMINVNSRGVVRKASMDTKDEVERVLLLAPGLVRRDPDKPEKSLTPTVICVRVVHPEVVSSGDSGCELTDLHTASSMIVKESKSQDVPQSFGASGSTIQCEKQGHSARPDALLGSDITNSLGVEDDLVSGICNASGRTVVSSEELPDAKEVAEIEATGQQTASRSLESSSSVGTLDSNAAGRTVESGATAAFEMPELEVKESEELPDAKEVAEIEATGQQTAFRSLESSSSVGTLDPNTRAEENPILIEDD